MLTLFKELAGSPTEQYDCEGFRATRTFLIAWEDRDTFAIEVMGPSPEQGGTAPIHYPGKPTVLAVRLHFEPFDPFDPDAPDIQQLYDLTIGLNSYSNSFAKATIDYQTTTP